MVEIEIMNEPTAATNVAADGIPNNNKVGTIEAVRYIRSYPTRS